MMTNLGCTKQSLRCSSISLKSFSDTLRMSSTPSLVKLRLSISPDLSDVSVLLLSGC